MKASSKGASARLRFVKLALPVLVAFTSVGCILPVTEGDLWDDPGTIPALSNAIGQTAVSPITGSGTGASGAFISGFFGGIGDVLGLYIEDGIRQELIPSQDPYDE